MKKIALFFLAACLGLAGCERFSGDENPAAEGFHAEASDERAIALADSVMQAMGGRRAWDNTRYLGWNFFGARRLLWDKHQQRVRIEVPNDFSIYLIDLQRNSGRIMRYGEELTHPDSLAKYVEKGRQIWVNDSYWLFMPFKLKDSGVTLKYVGEDTLQGGRPAEVVELRFDNVGFTPENKYRVYIDPQNHLVKQWAFYRQADADKPDFISPWTDYQQYGQIKLAGNRGENEISEIAVYDDVPDEAFTSFEYQWE